MTREQAVARLKRLYNGKHYWRVGQHVTSPERRQEASTAIATKRARREELDADIKARLAALDWYREMTAERHRLYAEIQRLQGDALSYKFSVGVNKGWCVEITGQGDTWEEAIGKAERKA